MPDPIGHLPSAKIVILIDSFLYMSIVDTCSFLQIASPSNGIFVTLFVTLKAKTALQISVMPFSAVRGGF